MFVFYNTLFREYLSGCNNDSGSEDDSSDDGGGGKRKADPRYDFKVDYGSQPDINEDVSKNSNKIDMELVGTYLEHKEWAAKHCENKERLSKWEINKKKKDSGWKRKQKSLSTDYDSWHAISEASNKRWNQFIECGSLTEIDVVFPSKRITKFHKEHEDELLTYNLNEQELLAYCNEQEHVDGFTGDTANFDDDDGLTGNADVEEEEEM